MNFPELCEIEWAYDSNLLSAQPFSSLSGIQDVLRAIDQSQWQEAYARCEELFSSHENTLVKAFILQWAVVTAEIEYNITKRGEWLVRWDDIAGWGNEPYCQYLRFYQNSLTSFFDGSLQEAQARFSKAYDLATKIQYERGRMRCLFHLGLIQKEKSNPEQAKAYFLQALEIATIRNATRFKKRIVVQLALLNPKEACDIDDFYFDVPKQNLETLINGREWEKARRCLIELELKRRLRVLGRKTISLYIYHILILWSRGRDSVANRLFRRIGDPIIKIRILEIKAKSMGLCQSDQHALLHLKEIHGVTTTVRKNFGNPELTEINGVSLSDVKDKDVKALILLLLSHQGHVTKEDICIRIWGLNYDPTIHDTKVYKLIHRSKKIFGKTDIFTNNYGSYQLNRKFFGFEPLVSKSAS